MMREGRQGNRSGLIDAVVIGGSAGATEALLHLLAALPSRPPVPLLVVIHTPPDRPSALVPALAAHVSFPVREPEDKEPLLPGTLYAAPSGYHLLVDDGPSASLSVDDPVNHSRPSIDVLFWSAADLFHDRVAAVLLSGANADGAEGLAAIGARGGPAFVQSLREAAVSTMPAAGLRRCATARAAPAAVIGSALASLFYPGAELAR
jgi:two-component system, chemotaxis family, protein-glutamate methylesterase/glutaminase